MENEDRYLNFGLTHNGMDCKCGEHFGVGDWSAEDRAATYARMRRRTPSAMTSHNVEFLNSWEKQHGAAKYEIIYEERTTTSENRDIYWRQSLKSKVRVGIAKLVGQYAY